METRVNMGDRQIGHIMMVLKAKVFAEHPLEDTLVDWMVLKFVQRGNKFTFMFWHYR